MIAEDIADTTGLIGVETTRRGRSVVTFHYARTSLDATICGRYSGAKLLDRMAAGSVPEPTTATTCQICVKGAVS